jgi:hypothetical protein
MILFKRVSESFSRIEGREWALLTLETLGVVAGILIAFELQEWAARRNDAARHDQLMQRLFEESEMDVLLLRSWRQDVASIVEPEKAFAIAIAKGECPTAAQWEAVNTVNMMPAITAPTSVYQELTSAGGLASVDRRDVRLALARFHDTLDWAQRQVGFFRDARIVPLDPSDRRARVTFDPAQDEPEVWSFDRPRLCADQAFKNRMASATRAHLVYAGYQQSVTDSAIMMCAALGEGLGRRCTPGDGPLLGADARLAQKTVGDMRKKPSEN